MAKDTVTSLPWPRRIDMYLHGDGETNEGYTDPEEEDGGILAGVNMDNWRGALYEVEFDVLVYEDGTYKVIGIVETEGEAVEKVFKHVSGADLLDLP